MLLNDNSNIIRAQWWWLFIPLPEMVAAGGWWWPQLAGCRPTLGSIPLSVSRLAVMSIMSTLWVSSLLVAAFLPVKFTLWKSGATKTKRGAKCQMSQTQIKYFPALLNQYLTFLRAVFRLSDILSVGVENWREQIFMALLKTVFKIKSLIFGLNIARNKQASWGGGVTLLGPNCTMEVVALVTFNVPRFVLPKLFAC